MLASSSTYDTDPVGEVLDQPSFLNACVRVETALEPLELLDAVKRLERELGREPAACATARARSTSTCCCSASSSCATQRMTLPHEQLLSRRFVLIPALELDFELRRARWPRLADALAALALTEGVRWAGPPLELPIAAP